MNTVCQQIPLIVDADMNFIYHIYDPDNINIMLEDKIRESIIYLLSWLNKYVLVKPQTGHFIREKLKQQFKLDAINNIYLFNSFRYWRIYHQELSSPIDTLNNQYIQPEYIGHTDCTIDWNMKYSIFTYPKLISIETSNQPPLRDETGKIIFYYKIGDRMVPIDTITDISEMFPGTKGSPSPRIHAINKN